MDGPIAVSRQKMVDALRALVADLGPAGRVYAERVSLGQGFDVNQYFSVLSHLSMEPMWGINSSAEHTFGCILSYLWTSLPDGVSSNTR